MNIVRLALWPLGRIGRRQFWLVALPALFAALIGWRLARVSVWSVATPVIIVVLWILISLCAKRLRDAGYSAWLLATPVGLVLVPTIADMLMWGGRHLTGLGDVAGPLMFSLNLRLLLWACFVFLVWTGLSQTKLAR